MNGGGGTFRKYENEARLGLDTCLVCLHLPVDMISSSTNPVLQNKAVLNLSTVDSCFLENYILVGITF